MVNSDLINEIYQSCFGNRASNYNELLDSIIGCSKLEHFTALNLDLLSPQIADLFENASKTKNTLVISHSRGNEIYKKLKAITSNTDFI